jgi:TrpR-related protein YerC/YecD
MKNNRKNHVPYADELFEAVLKVESLEECRALFEDLCTPNELGAISQRLYVAKLLNAKHVYNDIVKMTGASTATISRVNRSLRAGSGGYEKVFASAEKELQRDGLSPFEGASDGDSGYSLLAKFYDELTGDIDYPVIAKYYDDLIRARGVTGGILLDLACGTGTLSVLMAELGWDVVAVDSSAEMLAHARAHRNCCYICQNMNELNLYGTVNAAICSLDGLNHVADAGELLEILRRVSLFTEPGGVFVFDINTPFKHETTLGNNTFVKESDSVFCVWQNEYVGDGEIQMELNIFEAYNNLYKRHDIVLTEKAFPLSAIQQMCEQVGLKVREQRNFPGIHDEDKVVFVCVKEE